MTSFVYAHRALHPRVHGEKNIAATVLGRNIATALARCRWWPQLYAAAGTVTDLRVLVAAYPVNLQTSLLERYLCVPSFAL